MKKPGFAPDFYTSLFDSNYFGSGPQQPSRSLLFHRPRVLQFTCKGERPMFHLHFADPTPPRGTTLTVSMEHQSRSQILVRNHTQCGSSQHGRAPGPSMLLACRTDPLTATWSSPAGNVRISTTRLRGNIAPERLRFRRLPGGAGRMAPREIGDEWGAFHTPLSSEPRSVGFFHGRATAPGS